MMFISMAVNLNIVVVAAAVVVVKIVTFIF